MSLQASYLVFCGKEEFKLFNCRNMSKCSSSPLKLIMMILFFVWLLRPCFRRKVYTMLWGCSNDGNNLGASEQGFNNECRFWRRF